MNIETLKQVVNLLESSSNGGASVGSVLKEGKKYYIRTVTHHQVGKCLGIEFIGSTPFVLLEKASWVADSGRWSDALKDGFKDNAEIEPCPGVVRVNVTSIIDVFDWEHDLPTKQQ